MLMQVQERVQELQAKLFGMDREEEAIKALQGKMLLTYMMFKESGLINILMQGEILLTKQVLKTLQMIMAFRLITPAM